MRPRASDARRGRQLRQRGPSPKSPQPPGKLIATWPWAPARPNAPVVASTVFLATVDVGLARIVLHGRVAYCTDEAMPSELADWDPPGHPERGGEFLPVWIGRPGRGEPPRRRFCSARSPRHQLGRGHRDLCPVGRDALLYTRHQDVRGKDGQQAISERLKCRSAAGRLALRSDYGPRILAGHSSAPRGGRMQGVSRSGDQTKGGIRAVHPPRDTQP